MIKKFKHFVEDVYAADRKEKQWVDPETGKTKKRIIQTHRIEFKASQLHQAAGAKDAVPDYLNPNAQISRPPIEADRPDYLETDPKKKKKEQK